MYLRLLIAFICALTLTGQAPPATSPTVPAESGDAKPATVSGKVTSAAGQPIRKATVTLHWVGAASHSQQSPAPYTATSDAEGNFIFEAVDPGRYMLSSDRPGFQRQTYGARRMNGGGTVLALTPGQKMAALDLVMSPQIVVSGKVLDSDGDPVPRAQVRAMRYMYFNGKRQIVPMGFASTDENGEYKLQNLVPGKVYVSASALREAFFGQGSRTAAPRPPAGQPAKQEEAAVATFYPGVTDLSAATLIELVAGQDRPATNITLRKSAVFHVRGKVTGQVPNDRAQLRVILTSRSSTFMDYMGGASGPVGQDGTFDLSQVAPGAHNLILINAMGNFKTLGTVPVDVGSHDVENVTLTAEPPFDLNGQVKFEKLADSDKTKSTKTTPGPARISLMPVEGPAINVPNASSKDDDTFSLVGVAAGHFRLNVVSIPEGFYLKQARYGDQDVLRNGLTIAPGGGSTLLEITLGAGAAKLDGTVQTADGKPAPSTVVTLIPDPPSPDRTDLYKQGNTDQNGHFTINSIAPGKYRAYAWTDLDQGIQFDPEFIKNYETKGTKLDIAESGTPTVALTPIEQ